MAAVLLRMSRGAQSLFVFSGKPAVLHRAIHTSVWWDLNSVRVPRGGDLCSIAGNITDALATLNYSAPVTFSAYGDKDRLRMEEWHDLDDLSSAGIKFTDVYLGLLDPEVSSKHIFRDLWFWTKDYPAPANCLFITGDRDLSFALHQLAMKRYNILLAKPKELPGEMEAAATIIWHWKSLSAGGPPERTN